ncbi:MAG: recombinase RecA [Synergistetes bacterium]|nr:MAG: Protein RecA [bacterium 42_11]MBC7331866.1 recombinase RecA [Synergistota bacterium]MDK2871714.1 recombination protein RecA [bacterium]
MTLDKVSSERERMLKEAISRIEKSFGKGAIMRLGEESLTTVEVIPSGILPLDIALGVGGFPRGRIVEIFGPEGSGKTTVALYLIASAQKLGGVAAFIDAEHALDPRYAKRLGIKVEDLLLSQPDSGEQALEIVETLVRSGAVDVIVVDSVAALVPQAEIEGAMGDAHVALQARLMSQALRKLTAAVGKTRSIVVFINQIREKVSTGYYFGPTETTPGGRALKFYSSLRLDVRRGETIKQGQETLGSRVKVKVVKNKVAPPFREAEFDLIYGEGVSRASSVLEGALLLGVIRQSGSWFYFGEERLGQGKETAKNYLQENPHLMDEIEKAVLERLRGEETRGQDKEASQKEDLFNERSKK